MGADREECSVSITINLPKPKQVKCSSYSLSPEILSANPNCAVEVTHTIATVSWIDCQIQCVVVNLLPAEGGSLTHILSHISSADRRQQLIRKILLSKLGEEQEMLAKKIFKSIDPVLQLRHEFAHHLWGHSSDHPDGLLLMPPSRLVKSAGTSSELFADKGLRERIISLLAKLALNQGNDGGRSERLTEDERETAMGIVQEIRQNPRTSQLMGEARPILESMPLWTPDDLRIAAVAAGKALKAVIEFSKFTNSMFDEETRELARAELADLSVK